MPQQPTYPGVYVEEIPSGVHTVTGVATSVAAFVDFFKEGPMDQAVKIYGMSDFNRIFGGLDDRSEAGYAISQFFLNGGAEAWVIRTAALGPNPLATASVLVKAGTGPADADILKISAISPGVWGNNLAVDIDLDTADPATQFNLGVTRYATANGQRQAVAAERFLNLTLTPGSQDVGTVVNAESKLIQAECLNTGNLPAPTGTMSNDLSGLFAAPGFDSTTLCNGKFGISINGSDFMTATLGTWTSGDGITSLEKLRRFLEAAIRQANPASAAFNGASVQVVNKTKFRIVAGRQGGDYDPCATIRFQAFTPTGGGPEDPTAHTLLLLDSDNSLTNVQEYVLGLVPTAETTIRNADGSADILKIWAAQPGVGGNTLRVDIDYSAAGPQAFNLTVRQYDGTTGDAGLTSSTLFQNLALDKTDSHYVETIINASTLLRVQHVSANDPAHAADLPAASGLVSGDVSALATADFDALRGSKFKAGLGSLPVKSTTIIADAAWTDGAVTNLSQFAPYLQAAIRSADSSLNLATVTVVKNKYLQVRAGLAAGASYSPDSLLHFQNQNSSDKTASDKLKLTDAAPATASSNAAQEYALAAPSLGALAYAETGADGDLPGCKELLGLRVKPYSGLYALENADLFNLLSLPRAAELDNPAEMNSLLTSALAYCRERRAFLLIDIPKANSTVEAMDKWLQSNANLRDPNAAVYYPRLLQPDPMRGYQLRSVGASGTLAGLYARIDSTRGVWKAPAGTEATLAGIMGTDAQVTDMQNGALNPLGINCFRNFPVYGLVSWGGRTSAGSDQQASDWKYIPVRRLALFLEESLFRGTKWVVFEPNDEPLWAKIRLNLNAFMMSLFRQGAFQGSTPDQAYYVKCDSDTTTQDDRNHGIVNIEVGFAPLKPAEFVVLKFQQIAGQL